MNKEQDCYNCIKNDVCIHFIKNNVKWGKYGGCDEWKNVHKIGER